MHTEREELPGSKNTKTGSLRIECQKIQTPRRRPNLWSILDIDKWKSLATMEIAARDGCAKFQSKHGIEKTA
jgi:hypothetical protein